MTATEQYRLGILQAEATLSRLDRQIEVLRFQIAGADLSKEEYFHLTHLLAIQLSLRGGVLQTIVASRALVGALLVLEQAPPVFIPATSASPTPQ